MLCSAYHAPVVHPVITIMFPSVCIVLNPHSTAGLPVVSLSIGDSCEFAYAPVPKKTVNRGDGEEFPGEKTVKLESGDLLVFGGPSRLKHIGHHMCANLGMFRLVFHGVRRVMSNTKPKGVMMRPGRLNLTFRQFSMK